MDYRTGTRLRACMLRGILRVLQLLHARGQHRQALLHLRELLLPPLAVPLLRLRMRTGAHGRLFPAEAQGCTEKGTYRPAAPLPTLLVKYTTR